MKTCLWLACCCVVCVGCTDGPSSPVKNTEVIKADESQPASPLAQLKLTVGMKRAELEKLVAEATGVASKYRVHTMHDEREARYQDGTTVLIVKFKPGFPAPWRRTPDGGAEHMPPMDATVESWELKPQ